MAEEQKDLEKLGNTIGRLLVPDDDKPVKGIKGDKRRRAKNKADVKALGKDLDGAFRARDRLDGKA